MRVWCKATRLLFEVAQLLDRAADAPPDMYRTVFMLREVDGLNTTDTAIALGVSEDVVKTPLSRARAALRANLEQFAD